MGDARGAFWVVVMQSWFRRNTRRWRRWKRPQASPVAPPAPQRLQRLRPSGAPSDTPASAARRWCACRSASSRPRRGRAAPARRAGRRRRRAGASRTCGAASAPTGPASSSISSRNPATAFWIARTAMRLPRAAQENAVRSPRAPTARSELVALRLVVAERELRVVADGNDALLPPLPAHLHLLRHEVEVGAVDPAQLRQAHPGRVEQLEDREVADVGEVALPSRATRPSGTASSICARSR